MLRLYCRCGYPLWVAARSLRPIIDVLVFDGTLEAEQTRTPLQQCPQCHMVLRPHHLERHRLTPSSAAQPRSDHENGPPPLVSAPVAPLRLPAAAPIKSQDGPGEYSMVKRQLPQWQPPGASPQPRGTRRVLVVDDDQDVREVLQQWLESEGFQVASARDGVEALALLQREPGGWVILLDLLMPRMDGWAVLQQLQADATVLEDHKVVLMSASWMLAHEGPPWRSPQVVAAVRKPFDHEHLRAMLFDLFSA